jgi:ferredoxin
MKRKIIKIDDTKCDGCGMCVPDCPEGALQIIENKARLVSDLFCDGLGACIGTCPQGAITVEEREAEPYDERKVMENIVKQGPAVIKAHLDHLEEHKETDLLNQARAFLEEKQIAVPGAKPAAPAAPHAHHGGPHGHHGHDNHGGHAGPFKGCPGTAARDMRSPKADAPDTGHKAVSKLQNWPVQLQLMNPYAPYLKNADLLISADCVPYAYAGFHQRFLDGKIMITFCPKLDQTIDQYIEKLAVIFKENDIKSLSVVHMEVPCCSGTVAVVQKALEKAQKFIPVKDYTISISGDII